MNIKKIPNIYQLMQMIILSSFIGYVVENLFKLFMNGYIDNRYMFLPFLLGYGLFIAVLGIFIGTPQNFLPLVKRKISFRMPVNYLIYFLVSAVLVSLGELALGMIVEKIGGFYYWDYSNLPLHFTRYTSLPTSAGFGLIITLFMGFVYEPSMRFFERKMTARVWKIITIVVTVLLVADFIASFVVMIATGERMVIWRIYLFDK